ncbi:CxC5 domain-containing protein [Favolaschia claudopus]|uniref:CxC5 domain-containing protein n=1 Tax=Favolaschia claudopus TaxID=2862362 RepID=A0AAW0BK81_9AGAR
MPSVGHLISILDLFFPPGLAIQQAFYVLGVLVSLFPILQLHINQLNEASRQRPDTGWMRSIRALLIRAFRDEAYSGEAWLTGIDLAEEYSDYIARDFDRLYQMLGLSSNTTDPASFLFPSPQPILCTRRVDCKFCPPEHRNRVPSIRRRSKGKCKAPGALTRVTV